jgi:hypothetical protein
MKTIFGILLSVSLVLLLVSCGGSGGGAKTIQPGTPAFFWAGAKQAWQSGDFIRTAENLSKLTQSENEFRNRAEVWLMIVSSGLSEGYMEYADAFDIGAKANREKALDFRRQASAARSQAKAYSLQFVEAAHYFGDKVKDPKLTLEFPYPTGSLADVPGLQKVAKGMLPLASDAESAQRSALQKNVLKAVCRALGVTDSAKALEMFKQVPVEVTRDKFILGMSESLNDVAQLYSQKQLDEPLRVKMLCAEAVELVKQVPSSKQSKEIDAKLQKTLKTIKSS